MLIIVKLFASLQTYAPTGNTAGAPSPVEMPDQATIADLIARLGLPEGQAKVTFVNGRSRTEDFFLQDGDEVGIFPPVGGG